MLTTLKTDALLADLNTELALLQAHMRDLEADREATIERISRVQRAIEAVSMLGSMARPMARRDNRSGVPKWVPISRFVLLASGTKSLLLQTRMGG